MNKQRTQIKPGQTLDLDLTEAERKHILDDINLVTRVVGAVFIDVFGHSIGTQFLVEDVNHARP